MAEKKDKGINPVKVGVVSAVVVAAGAAVAGFLSNKKNRKNLEKDIDSAKKVVGEAIDKAKKSIEKQAPTKKAVVTKKKVFKKTTKAKK